MAEAEDVLVDAARHATELAQRLLRRRRAPCAAPALTLLELAPRLGLLLTALHGRPWQLRVAQPPAPATLLKRLLHRHARVGPPLAVPCADGTAIWLPRELDGVAPSHVPALYRAMALQQSLRATRRDAAALARLHTPLERDLYLVLESEAAGAALARALPGLRGALVQLRDEALRRRPPVDAFPPDRRPLEGWLRDRPDDPHPPPTTDDLVTAALALADRWRSAASAGPVFKDWWTGDWAPGDAVATAAIDTAPCGDLEEANGQAVRSARLARRPAVRAAAPDEDDAKPGAWMVQTAQPHEHAEDPMGQQRPADRDADQAAEAHAESVSELPQARLVRSARRAREVLLSDEPPETLPRPAQRASPEGAGGIRYPEWDYRAEAYRDPGTTVWESLAPEGPEAWVERTLQSRAGMLAAVRRRFEMLRAQRVVLRRQDDGDELDLEACIEARADRRAGAALSQRLYRNARALRRDTAVLVLVDASGSTDAWVAGQRRIIDVEREALLPLSIALDGCGDPSAILSFSGEGPHRVLVNTVKRFDERHGIDVARRIAGLEPQRYTRAGAALRHASRLLAEQPARRRLLVLLSDGKPNDCDEYEGRYGVEDLRRAVLEARRLGQSPFCLTVDRQAPAYLPRVFGPHDYALLQRPERLPVVLLEWLKRLLCR